MTNKRTADADEFEQFGEGYDDEDDPGIPPNPDGSVRIDQMGLVCAIGDYIAKKHPGLMVHARQFNAIIFAANYIVAAYKQPIVMATPGMGIRAWLQSDDTGLSSMAMARKLVPESTLAMKVRVPGPSMGSSGEEEPSDPSDLGRCIRLLEAAPELRPHLHHMSAVSPLWAAYMAKWDEMEALYREELASGKSGQLSDLMESIQKEVRECAQPAATQSKK